MLDILWLAYIIGLSKVIKVGGKQNPYEMWQAGNSLAASPLVNSLAGFAREEIWRLRRTLARSWIPPATQATANAVRRSDENHDVTSESLVANANCIYELFCNATGLSLWLLKLSQIDRDQFFPPYIVKKTTESHKSRSPSMGSRHKSNTP